VPIHALPSALSVDQGQRLRTISRWDESPLQTLNNPNFGCIKQSDWRITMTFKEFLDAHPLPTLVTTVLATTSATTGVVTYIDSSNYKNETIRLELSHKEEVSSLKSLLASIERRVGIGEKTFFDVSQLLVTFDQIKFLKSQYKSAENGLFYYVIPIGVDWKFEKISEAELIELKLGTWDEDDILSKFKKFIQNKNIYIWRKTDVITALPVAKSGMEKLAPKSIVFFPMASVQAYDLNELGTLISDTKNLFSDNEIINYAIKSLTKDITTENNTLRNCNLTKTTIGANFPEFKCIESKSVESKNLTEEKNSTTMEGEKKLEKEQILESLFRGDLAARMLLMIISGSLRTSEVLADVDVKLNNIQKKGNVLYVQMSIIFNSINLLDQKVPTKLIVDREIFLVNNSKMLYLVNVEVPSTDGRSDDYNWIGQWLSGIRLPI
jgi:hypothetical protein